MRLNTTYCVYCQADNICMASSSINTDDNGTAVISADEAIKRVMKIWQLMVRMQKKIVIMGMMWRKKSG